MSKKISSLGGGVIMAIGLFVMAGTAFAATPSVVSVKLTGPT